MISTELQTFPFVRVQQQNPPFPLIQPGKGNQAFVKSLIKKFSIQRVNGESIPVQNMQVATTGDGIVVSATFNVP